ncbi:MAG: AI-2E family transporter [Fimbriimonadaceae bacterium]|nr:AI-2E family transporter [Fimbriimonadaceae bacterium]
MNAGMLLILILGLLVAFAYAAGTGPAAARTRRWLGGGLVAVVLVGLVYQLRAVLPPFIVPLVLAYLLDPVLDRLERRGLSRTRAILLVYAALLTLMISALLLLVPPVVKQVGEIAAPLAKPGGVDLSNLQGLLANQEKLRKGLAKTALDAGLRESWVRQLEENIASLNVEQRLTQAVRWLAEQAQKTAGWVAGQVGGLLWLILLPVTLFYMLRDYDPLRRRLYYLVPPANRAAASALTRQINTALGAYLRGYAVLSLAVAICVTAILLLLQPFFGFRYGLLVGLTAGATYIIPYVGSFSSVILGVAVVYFTGGHSLGEALAAFVLLQGCNTLFDNVITPRVLGGQTGLHPLWVMFALLVAGSQFGLLGVVLSTPTAVCVKIVLEHFFPRLTEPIPADQTPEAADCPAADEDDAPAGDRKDPDA